MSGERTSSVLIDKAAVERKYAQRRENPYRTKEGSFHLPRDMRPKLKNAAVKQKVAEFISQMGRRSWVLADSNFKLSGPYTAHDIGSEAVLLDMHEYRVRLIFKWDGGAYETGHIEYPSEGLGGPGDDLDVGNSEKDLATALRILR